MFWEVGKNMKVHSCRFPKHVIKSIFGRENVKLYWLDAVQQKSYVNKQFAYWNVSNLSLSSLGYFFKKILQNVVAWKKHFMQNGMLANHCDRMSRFYNQTVNSHYLIVLKYEEILMLVCLKAGICCMFKWLDILYLLKDLKKRPVYIFLQMYFIP